MKTNPRKVLMKLNRRKPMRIETNRNIDSRIKQKRKINMNINSNRKSNMKDVKSKNISFFLMLLIATAGIISAPPEVLALGQDTTDAGLNTSVTNLLAILNNKLTPVVLIAGCLASLIYSFAIAQPKPFILGLVTLCAFGFAKAWINGTYALIG